ncbi:MAG: carbon monoxide dehydrogenase [Desulfobacterales bacterium C00003106]|nr:MAG: carbon monoxide dehydrogenase [Desulfobacterales bacterium C00003106]OEU59254.1 MAG: carbon monoxide dehydrogenase [Desulfobacterales bacterium C00003104]
MSSLIAMAGKGGTGKTTIAGFLIKYLINHNMKPILAVDADPNSNLNEVLGINFDLTLGEAREGLRDDVPVGMTREMYIEYKVQQAIVEEDGYDLIVMGRPEGAGCYCHANMLLSKYIEMLTGNYRSIVMDNEAGMEHISRLVAKEPGLLLIVSDPTMRGVETAGRIQQLSKELNLGAKKTCLIINRVHDQLPESIIETINKFGLTLAGCVPEDSILSEFDAKGKPTSDLTEESKAVRAVTEIFDRIIGC